MSVPKKRRTKASVRQRRLHDSLDNVTLNDCPKCHKAVKAHQACGFCGHYNGKDVLKIKVASLKKAK